MKATILLTLGFVASISAHADHSDSQCDQAAIGAAKIFAGKQGIQLLESMVIKREMATGDVDLLTVWGRSLNDSPYEFAVTVAQSEGPCRWVSTKPVSAHPPLLPASGRVECRSLFWIFH